MKISWLGMMKDMRQKVMNSFLDEFLLFLVGVLIVVVVGLLGWVIIDAIQDSQFKATHTCAQSHIEHKPSYTTITPVGKVMVPVNHPARDVEVCDKWVEK